MKQSNILFGAITFVLLSMAIVSAVDIYAGQDYSFASEEFEYFEVVGNTSSIEGMDINWENGNTTISFDKGFVSDSFNLVLFNTEKEVIVEHHYSSGNSGGTRTVYEDRNITKYEFMDREYGDREKEIVTETVTETVVENKVPIWVWVVVGVLFLIVVVGVIIYFKEGALFNKSLNHLTF